MSCMVAQLAGGNPQREIFPLTSARMDVLRDAGVATMLALLNVKVLADVPGAATHQVGVALKPDGSPFYLSTIASNFDNTANPVGPWRGAFYAPFGVANVFGVVSGDLQAPGALPTTINVEARLMLDPGDNPPKGKQKSVELVHVKWEIMGNQATRANKASLIRTIDVVKKGPHSAEDIRRCIALHAPQRVFGMPPAIVAMQCGVAVACLIEAIC